MDDVSTMTREYRQYPEYSELFSTRRADDQFEDRPQRESTQVKWGGQDGRREPDSGIAYTQDHRTWWTDDGWVELDPFAPNTVQLTGRKRRAGGIPRKRALFASDGPDSTTSSSDILEGHYDRPPEEGYSDIPNSGRPHDVHVAEELCSSSRQLETAVVRLQQDIADYHAELKYNRTQTPAVSTRPPKRSGFTSTSVPRFSRKSNWEQYRQVF